MKHADTAPTSSSSDVSTELEEERHPAGEAPHDEAIDRVLERVEIAEQGEERAAPRPRMGSLRTARVRCVTRHEFVAVFRGGVELAVELDEGVDAELVRRAAEAGDRVLVEEDDVLGPVIVGVVTTRLPETIELKARKIIIEGEEEIVLRSGTAAMRMREDGDVELVGSRIVTMSRGLFRLVGKMLRLN
jgi:hypothetical protein